MRVNRARPKTIFALLENDHNETLQKLCQFEEVLGKLRYEGKVHFGKNMAEISSLIAYFKRELCAHMRDEEKTLFPYLQVHIPKLDPMINLLLSEHEDLRNSLVFLKTALKKRKKHFLAKRGLIDKICYQGTYLVCLLRNHMRVESRGLYKAADKELRTSEKRNLIKQIGQP